MSQNFRFQRFLCCTDVAICAETPGKAFRSKKKVGTFWAAVLIFSIALLLFNKGTIAKELAPREVLTYFMLVKQFSLDDI